MFSISKLFGTLFISVTLIFLVIVSLSDAFQMGLTPSLVQNLLSAIVAGFLFSAIMTYLQVRSIHKLAEDNPNIGPRQSVQFEVSLPYETAFFACAESVKELNKAKINMQDFSGGEIVARTGMSWQCLGERVVCQVKRIGDNLTAIRVSSLPVSKFALVDFGKNLANIHQIERGVKSAVTVR